MKINKLYTILFGAAISWAAISCSDVDAPKAPAGEGNAPDEVTLSLAVPDFTVENIASRAESPAISSLTVVCYSRNDLTTPLSTHRLTGGWTTSDGRIEVTVPLHRNTVNLQLVANAPETVSLSGDLSKVFVEKASDNILWAMVALKDVLEKPTSAHPIAMLRSYAKVSAQSSATNFTITGIGVYGTAMTGSIAPTGNDPSSNTPNIAENETFNFSSGNQEAGTEISIFETPKDNSVNPKARIIIRGTYNGVDGYYPVAFRTRKGSGSSDIVGNYTYEDIAVVRNHHYKVSVTEVRGQGFPSYDEACKGEPDNRMTVVITDEEESVTSIVASRDYELGVSDRVEAQANNDRNAPTAVITVVSSRAREGNDPHIVLNDDASWIKTESIGKLPDPVKVSMKSDINPDGYKYVISVPLEVNSTAERREGTITVRSGELSQTITVVQFGTDYLRDPARPVQFYIGNQLVASNYFDWVVTTLRGATAESFHQEGVQRDNGLNFPAVAPSYVATYYIKKVEGDQSAKITSGTIFKCSTVGDNYVVQMENQSASGITQGELTIVNKNGVTIKYPLYRTGYIHELTTSTAQYQMEEDVRTGWYYYEVVNCGNQWTTDRNIGADSGRPFISTSSALKKYSGATGAFFKISTGKASSTNDLVTKKLSMHNWTLPEISELKAMNITVSDITPTGSERTMVAGMNTSNGSKLTRVFIPHFGYFEATSHKYETHANLWTKTLVSGNQGFSQSSPEYGYWVQYLDVYNSSVNFSNIRLANGSSGQAPNDNSVFKYMPIRPVWK